MPPTGATSPTTSAGDIVAAVVKDGAVAFSRCGILSPMPSKKQQRRRQKLKRHEYEEVYVDEEGNELAPEEAEELVAAIPRRKREAGEGAADSPRRPHDRAAVMASHAASAGFSSSR